jgi:hypothetical protein
MRSWKWWISVLAGVALALPSVAAACPNCNDAVKGDPVAAALSGTTLLLIALPASLMGSIGAWVALAFRRAARAEEERPMPFPPQSV